VPWFSWYGSFCRGPIKFPAEKCDAVLDTGQDQRRCFLCRGRDGKDALAKLAELTEVGHSEVTANDMSGAIIDLTTLQAEANDAR
jgi:hypothetical protein